MAKSIRGIGKYGDLNKAQLIDKIIKTKKPTPVRKLILSTMRTKKPKIPIQHQESFKDQTKKKKPARGT